MKNTINSTLLILATVTTSSASSIVLGGSGTIEITKDASGSDPVGLAYTENFTPIDLDDGAISYSGTIEMTASNHIGSLRVGIIVEDSFVHLFPGFGDPNRNGAVGIYQNINGSSRVAPLTPGNGTQGDLEFVPTAGGTFEFSILLTRNGANDVDLTLTVDEPGHASGAQSQTFDTITVEETALGADSGGFFDTLGVGIQLDGKNRSAGFNYSNVKVSTVASVPEPSLSVMLAIGSLTLSFRRSRN